LETSLARVLFPLGITLSLSLSLKREKWKILLATVFEGKKEKS